MTTLHILNGPNLGQSYDFKEGTLSLGRSPDNDIQLKDRTVSRNHLIIRKEKNRYFIRDLKSQNGTFFNGYYISPDIDVEVREGIPIVMGMSVICVGKSCLEYLMPVSESIEITKEIRKADGVFVQNRKNPNQKILELIYNVSQFSTESLDIHEISEKILNQVFKLLKRIDRGAIILLDPETGKIADVISRTKEPGEKTGEVFCQEVVDSVIRDHETVCIFDSQDEAKDDLTEKVKSMKIGSVMCVPLVGSSQILGAIYVDALQKPNGFRDKKDLAPMTELSKRATLALEQVLRYQNLD